MPPTASWLAPRKIRAGALDRPGRDLIVVPLGPEVPEKSTMPPALVMNRALPPVLLVPNCVSAPLLVVMVALPAVLVSANDSKKPPLS